MTGRTVSPFRITSFVLYAVVSCGAPFTAPPVSAEVTHGIIVGAVTDHSARFSLRLDTSDVVSIQVSTDSGFAGTVMTNTDTTTSVRNYVVILEASGLLADTKYYCRAVVGGIVDWGVTTFMTFPTSGTTPSFSFAFGSCQQSGNFLPSGTTSGAVFLQVLEAQPRFFLQIGDWGYPDTTDTLPEDSTFFAADYAKVQGSYLVKFRPDYPMDSLLRSTPVDYVYDDHDYMNDNSSALTSSFIVPFKPNQFGSDFVAREITNPPGARENSIRGYRENFPSYDLPNPSRGIYHSFRFGNAEFFVLDLRAQRSSNLEPFAVNPQSGKWEFHPTAEHSILGRESSPGSGETQLTWLLNGLANSTATWKFIASSVPFNQGFATAIQLAVLLQDVTINDPEYPPGSSLLAAGFELSDKWAGFQVDSDTLLHTIASQGISNVIVLSGDSHTAAIDDGANAGLPEIMAGGLDIRNSQIVKLLTDYGLNIWNAGGQGLTTQQFNNAFGNVTVFGEDSVRLALIDELGTQFASLTVRNQVVTVGEPRAVPLSTRLEQNYPNPFNPMTSIEYTIGGVRGQGLGVSMARLAVYDVLGREVATLVNEVKTPGRYTVQFDGSALASGVYYYRLQAGQNAIQTRRMVLLR